MRIQSGCDRYCAFCIVPHLRGRPQSVPVEDCLRALQDLKDWNGSEIVLTGTNIALWGVDLPHYPRLQDLLKALLTQIDLKRLRLSSLEPELVQPDFLQWCTEQPQICRHFHFAVQSGSHEVLNRMGRGSRSDDLFAYLRELKRKDPTISLGADIIAGFPRETDTDFQNTLDLVRSIPFNYLHVFPYSERPGTKACEYPDQIAKSVRLSRAGQLRQLDKILRKKFAEDNVGRMEDIILMNHSAKGSLEGLTSNYLRLRFHKEFNPPGSRFSLLVGVDQIFPSNKSQHRAELNNQGR